MDQYKILKSSLSKFLMIVYSLMTIEIIIDAYIIATISKGCLSTITSTAGSLFHVLAPTVIQLLTPISYLFYCGLVLDSCYSDVKSMRPAVR